MADNGQLEDVDLDRTDQLPILEGASFADDVADDAVRLEFAPLAKSVKSEYRRASGTPLPSLAESVRAVEERIARRTADHEALTRSLEQAHAAAAGEKSRAAGLAAELAALRTQFDAELARSGELTKVLAAREATLSQTLRSLAERDTQLSALQREHAAIVPSLEERSAAAGRLAADLQSARGELAAARRDLGAAQAQATAHLELLRTREFRRGLADSGAAASDRESLTSERDELRRRVGELGSQLATAEHSRADLALEVLRLQAEAQEREGQMEVLLAHLQQARRSLGFGGAEAASTGAAAPIAAPVAAPSECSVDLIRIDGGRNETYAVGRRTRIGRAPGCEVLVDSSSVSRHHALLLTNLRDVIVEDLHSTNGVLVNGRKVSRQLLADGDILTVGDVEFRLSVKPGLQG